ncbi:hypothetical protein ACUXKH_001714 [Staphylococcus epidermidis]
MGNTNRIIVMCKNKRKGTLIYNRYYLRVKDKFLCQIELVGLTNRS